MFFKGRGFPRGNKNRRKIDKNRKVEAKSAQERTKKRNQAPREHPRTPQERPKSAPRAPESAQERPKSARALRRGVPGPWLVRPGPPEDQRSSLFEQTCENSIQNE